MYFCPCPCNGAIDSEVEENTFLALPRNLSYVRESYLDPHSVSARFVHAPQTGSTSATQDSDDTSQLLYSDIHRDIGRLHTDEISHFDDDPGIINSENGLAECALSSSFKDYISDPTAPSFICPSRLESEVSISRQPKGDNPQLSQDIPPGHVSLGSGRSFIRAVASSQLAAFLPRKENSLVICDSDFSSSVDQLPYNCDTIESVQPISSTSEVYADAGESPEYGITSSLSATAPAVVEQVLASGSCLEDQVNSSLHKDHQGDKESTSIGEKTVKDLPCYDQVFKSVGIHVKSIPSNCVQALSDTQGHSSNNHHQHKVKMDCREDLDSVQIPSDSHGTCGYNIGSQDGDSVVEEGGEKHGQLNDSGDNVIITSLAFSDNATTSNEIVEEGDDDHSKFLLTHGKSVYPKKMCHKSPLPPALDIEAAAKASHCSDDDTIAQCYQSPDSDAFSEEGVFVNMVDGLDTTEKSTTVSDASDDAYISTDSMFLSPDEETIQIDDNNKAVDEESEQKPKRMTVEEAISRAASDLSKMSMMMYPDDLSPSPSHDQKDSHCLDSILTHDATHTLCKSSKLAIHMSYENIGAIKSSKSKSRQVDLGESHVFEDSEFNFNRKGLRKSSSLKSNKTPPGTPHRKKAVRFADAMGLDLESVRHVLNMESPPRIPASAMADLKQGISEDRKDMGPRFLTPCFNQPGASDDFMSRVLNQKISLENAIITDLTITGFVRVANISFHKSVRVRYTHNGWATFHDIAASYVIDSCDGPTDRFSFSIVAPAYFVTGNRLEFAVSYNAGGAEYWDSNGGANYAFECFAKSDPMENESSWMHFL